MHRRAFLALCALTGCVGYQGPPSDDTDPEPALSLPVPEEDLVRAANRDALPAITEPAFSRDWSGVSLTTRTEFGVREINPRLATFDRVIGLVVDGEPRAYPLRVLDWHEIVNDDLLVTFCPLCGSAVVADREIDGRKLTFGVTGLLHQDNLVMYDAETDSLWSQLHAVAIRGPLTGTRLTLRPSSLTTWREWREAHPDTVVLLPPPFSRTVVGRGSVALRDYTDFPYGGYVTSDRVGLSDREPEGPLHPKTEVLGFASGGEAVAYPRPVVEREEIITDRVGETAVLVTVADGALRAFDPRVGGRVPRFSVDGEVLRADGSRWSPRTGEALDGPHAGTTLDPLPAVVAFWFAWHDAHPETRIYG
ncbi:DUF3179 domain-containing protein [Natronomonas sp. EA1]|uniref:DUF3179 domain-containing protein n=1 Tax=Natronomonas sp. EA1 TaxID=3421655 RepID=UPI003EBBBDF9